jgi:hypothetical protein
MNDKTPFVSTYLRQQIAGEFKFTIVDKTIFIYKEDFDVEILNLFWRVEVYFGLKVIMHRDKLLYNSIVQNV